MISADVSAAFLDREIPSRLSSAMRYSLLAGGKRLRPVLMFACARMLGGKEQDVRDGHVHIPLAGHKNIFSRKQTHGKAGIYTPAESYARPAFAADHVTVIPFRQFFVIESNHEHFFKCFIIKISAIEGLF